MCVPEARFVQKIIIFVLKLKLYLFGQPYGISHCNVLLTERILLSILCQSNSRGRQARQLLSRFASILLSRHHSEKQDQRAGTARPVSFELEELEELSAFCCEL